MLSDLPACSQHALCCLAESRCAAGHRRRLAVYVIFLGSFSNGERRAKRAIQVWGHVRVAFSGARTEASGRFRFGFCARREPGGEVPGFRRRLYGRPSSPLHKNHAGDCGGGAVSWRKLARGGGDHPRGTWNTLLINLSLKPSLLQPAAAILHRPVVFHALLLFFPFYLIPLFGSFVRSARV